MRSRFDQTPQKTPPELLSPLRGRQTPLRLCRRKGDRRPRLEAECLHIVQAEMRFTTDPAHDHPPIKGGPKKPGRSPPLLRLTNSWCEIEESGIRWLCKSTATQIAVEYRQSGRWLLAV